MFFSRTQYCFIRIIAIKTFYRLPPKFIPRLCPYRLPPLALPRPLPRRRFLPPPPPLAPRAITAIQRMKPKILKNQMRMQQLQPPHVRFLQHFDGAHFPSSDSSSESSSLPLSDEPDDEESSSPSSFFIGWVVMAGATWLLGKIVAGWLDLGSTWTSSILIVSDSENSIWIFVGSAAAVPSTSDVMKFIGNCSIEPTYEKETCERPDWGRRVE